MSPIGLLRRSCHEGPSGGEPRHTRPTLTPIGRLICERSRSQNSRRILSVSMSCDSSVVALVFVFAPSLYGQTGNVRGRVADSAGAALSGASVTVEGTGLRATSGDRRHLRDPRRAVRHPDPACPADRLLGGHRRRGRTSRRAWREQDFTLSRSTGAARADRRRGRLARAPHRRRGAGGAGGHLPRRGDPAAGDHRDQRRSSSRSPPR